MKNVIAIIGSLSGALVVAGCQPGGAGIAGGSIIGNQTAKNATVNGSMNNVVGSYNAHSQGGAGGRTDMTTAVNVPLTPAEVTTLFGGQGGTAPTPSKPQVQAAKATEQSKGNVSLQNDLARCLAAWPNCTFFVKR